MQGLETLRAHRREDGAGAILAEVGDRYRRETMGTLRLAFMSALVLELCAMIGTALVAATIGVQLIGGHLTLDAGLTVLLLAPELYNPLRMVGQQFHASADGLAAAGRVLDVLDEHPPLSTPEHPQPASDPRTAPLCFRERLLRLSGPPWRRGERPGSDDRTRASSSSLIGPSGSRQDNARRARAAACGPDSGNASAAAWSTCARCAPSDWRRQIAWVPQRAKLFAGTIAENIALSDPGRGAWTWRAQRATRDSANCSPDCPTASTR